MDSKRLMPVEFPKKSTEKSAEEATKGGIRVSLRLPLIKFVILGYVESIVRLKHLLEGGSQNTLNSQKI